MASRNGSATVAPKVPRMNVRRERCFFVMNMAAPFYPTCLIVIYTFNSIGWLPGRLHADSAGSNLVRIWNGALSTIPMTMEESR